MDNQCTWIGREREGCSHQALPGRSYCSEHLARVYNLVPRNTRRRRPMIDSAAMETLLNEAVLELEAEGYDMALERW